MIRRPPRSTLFSLHDALPISPPHRPARSRYYDCDQCPARAPRCPRRSSRALRSEEHTSELQSRVDLVCRLLLEKKKRTNALTDSENTSNTTNTETSL